MAKRTDKPSGKKQGRARRSPAPGKSKRSRAKPAGEPAGPVDVTALTVRELGELVGIPSATVREHVKAGAPCTAGRPRRLSLIEYAAWLNKEVSKRGEAAR